MRIGTGDDFLRSSGGTLTGPLVISANASPILTLNRPDGAAHDAIDSQAAGVGVWAFEQAVAQPRLLISQAGVAPRVSIRTDNGLLGVGLIPLSMLRVAESFASNAGGVVTLAGGTTVVSAAVLTVAVGDRILIGWQCVHLKGGVAGANQLSVKQTAGAGTVLFYNNAGGYAALGGVTDDPSQAALTTLGYSGYVEGRATVAGAVTISLVVASGGSNGSVGIGDGQIHVDQLRG